MHVVLLHDELSLGARADERDVLVQVEAISTALHELGHRTTTLGLTLDLQHAAQRLKELQPDLVFNLVEALGGQGRLIYLAPALLDSLGIRYTGARTEAMFLTSSKTLTKQLLVMHGLPTPPWLKYSASPSAVPIKADADSDDSTFRLFDFSASSRWIIKSVWEEASVGLDEDSVVTATDESELRAHIRSRLARIGGEGFAEVFIAGREFNLALLANADARSGCVVLPPAEIEFVDYPADKPRVVGYRAKWIEESFEFKNTRRTFEFSESDSGLLERLHELAKQCWHVFGLRGYARVDFRVDADGCPWILEINANPCISPDAGLVAAAQRAGMSYPDVVQRIIGDVR